MTFEETFAELFTCGENLYDVDGGSALQSAGRLLDEVVKRVDAAYLPSEVYKAVACLMKTSVTIASNMEAVPAGVLAEKLSELYERKNHDYGDVWNDELDLFGLLPFRIRIWEKLRRAVTLLSAPEEQKVSDESVFDTFSDITNYCVMTAMWMNAREKSNNPIILF